MLTTSRRPARQSLGGIQGRRRAVLLSPPGDLGQIVARSLVELGFDVLLICEPTSAIRFSALIASRIFMHPQVFSDADGIRNAILAEDQKEPVDVVIGSAYPALAILADIKDQLPCPVFPMSDFSLLEQLNDKRSFSALCAAVSVPTPAALFFDLDENPDPERIRALVGYPCVVKPADASGGDGLRIVYEADGLAEAVSHVRPYAANGYITQSFVPGQDVGLSVFAVAGEIRNWASFQCDGFWSTSFTEDTDLLNAVRRLVAHIDFTGVANFDARRDSRTGGLVFFECNPRFFRRVGASRNCGLDFVAAGLADLGLANPPAPALTRGQHLSVRDLFSRTGIGLVTSGKYSVKSASRDLLDVFRDPVPTLGATVKSFIRGVKKLAKPV